MITREQVNQLQARDVIHETGFHNSDGTCRRWRVNGKLKSWKRRPEDFSLPIKHGMWSYTYLTHDNVKDCHLPGESEDCQE